MTEFGKAYEFQALPFPIPDDMREKLIDLGNEAIKARKALEKAHLAAMADNPSEYTRPEINTPELEKLDSFIDRMRSEIGVTVVRDWLGRGSPTK